MSNRTTTHILKNSNILNRTLPPTLLRGEAIVNTANGVMLFSGDTSSTSGWTQSSPTTPTYWEVGSNLYDLNLRNQIKSYSGVTNLTGKFLSGTTTGFVLSDISNISGIDIHTTAFTYSNNIATISQLNGGPTLSIAINTMTGLTVNGSLSATTFYGDGSHLSGISTTDTYTTAFTYSNNIATISQLNGGPTLSIAINTMTGLTVNGSLSATTFYGDGSHLSGISTTDTYTTGFTYSNNIATINENNGGPALSIVINTMTGLTVNGSLSATTFYGDGSHLSGISSVNTYATAFTYSNNIATISQNNGGPILNIAINTMTGLTVNGSLSATTFYGNGSNLSGVSTTDTYTTGFTYTPASNTFTLKRNLGQPDLITAFNVVSGLTISNLSSNKIVYSVGGLLTTTASASFDGTNMSLPPSGSLSVGTGGLIIGSGGSPSVSGVGDLIINGNLTVFGDSVSGFTSQLYVEDPNISFNYNPTGSTVATSIGAGITIQDGNGIFGGGVGFEIRPMNTFTGLTSTNIPIITEYTASIGYSNRAWITQLNDIVIRSTSTSTPNGVRVLTEFDILDSGTY
jgi:hypothetical protein